MFSLHTLTLSAVLLSQICSTAAQLRRQNPKIKSIRQLESDQCATEPPTVGDKLHERLCDLSDNASNRRQLDTLGQEGF